jgi:tetratricopeptide (TPR) repeat protein
VGRTLTAVALGLAACAPSFGSAYDRSFAGATRAESAGRLDEALADYDRAAELATRKGDRPQAQWAAVDVLVRQDHIADALGRLDTMARDTTSERQAEAAYRAASLRIEHGDPDHGWVDLERVPRQFPTSGVAHVAVRRLVAHADDGGPRQGLHALDALERDVHDADLSSLIAFLSAEHHETLGDDQAARDAYVHIAEQWPYPHGAFFDDALWRASLLDEKLGRVQPAIDDLERMVSMRETTTLMGSYERRQYVPAMLRIGVLYRDDLHDHVKAREAFHRLYADFAHSTKRDDALWLEAALWRQDGDASTACARLATLVREFPDSRYVPCATASCEGLARPAGSDAPKTCHPYIERGDWDPTKE